MVKCSRTEALSQSTYTLIKELPRLFVLAELLGLLFAGAFRSLGPPPSGLALPPSSCSFPLVLLTLDLGRLLLVAGLERAIPVATTIASKVKMVQDIEIFKLRQK